MGRKRKWKCLLALLLAVSNVLTSCGLLPKEEEYEAAPLIKEYESEEYAFATVAREDVQLTKKISCVYSSAQESELAFGVSGQPVKNVYCSLGDGVKKGDLLAELDMGTLPQEQKELEHEKEQLELSFIQAKERLVLEKRRLALIGETESPESSNCEREILSAESGLELLSDKLSTLSEKIAARRLIAPADGTVSYLKNDLKGSSSQNGEVVLRLVGGEECYFVAEKEEADSLGEGDSVSVVVSSTTYEAVVELPKDDETHVYFVIDAANGQPEVGSRGSATFVLDEKKDVLCLSNKAIQKIGEKSAVYYEDENGIKNMKYIEVGLVGNQKSEILSGLEFGESVIVK